MTNCKCFASTIFLCNVSVTILIYWQLQTQSHFEQNMNGNESRRLIAHLKDFEQVNPSKRSTFMYDLNKVFVIFWLQILIITLKKKSFGLQEDWPWVYLLTPASPMEYCAVCDPSILSYFLSVKISIFCSSPTKKWKYIIHVL